MKKGKDAGRSEGFEKEKIKMLGLEEPTHGLGLIAREPGCESWMGDMG